MSGNKLKYTPEEFASLCFYILMREGEDKTPEYIKEKSAMLNDGYFSIQRLHPILRREVYNYCEKWAYPFPEEAEEFLVPPSF